MASQNSDSCDSQPIRATKPRRSNKPPSVKTAVIAKRIEGLPKLQIAKDLEISRPTVDAILAESNLDSLMEDGRIQAFRRIPAALQTLDVRLEKNSESAAIWLLDKCFDNAGKGAKPHDQGLTLAIQNLMGNIQVNQQVQASEPQPNKQLSDSGSGPEVQGK